jgi:hypothetical protein
MKRSIKMAFWNVEGLNQNSISPKVEASEFIELLNKHDVIGLAETHCDDNDYIQVEGFCTFKLCRPRSKKINRNFGGIAVLYRKEIEKGVTFLEHKNNDYVWIKMCKRFFGLEEDIFCCFAYIPPQNSDFYNKRSQDTLSFIERDIMLHSNNGKILLVGDLNARTANSVDFIQNDEAPDDLSDIYFEDKEILERTSMDTSTPCSRGRKLIDLCIAARLRILNGRTLGDSQGQYTCHKYSGSSVVDYAITSEEMLNRLLYFKINKFIGHLSDHNSICWAFKSNFYTHEMASSGNYEKMPIFFKWNQASIFQFQRALANDNIKAKINNFLNKRNMLSKDEVDSEVKVVTDILLDAAAHSLKSTKRITNRRKQVNKKWFDKTLSDLKKNVLQLSCLLQKYPHDTQIRGYFFKTLKIYNKTRKKKARQFKEKTLAELDELKCSNPQAYWKLLSTLKGFKKTNESNISLEQWELHFKELNTDNRAGENVQKLHIERELGEMEKQKCFNELNFKITDREILQCLKNLKNKKATGLDRISNELLKYSQHCMLPVLNRLFNHILVSGHYPTDWNKVYICPIFKNGDPLLTTNYRGIAIINSLSKVFNSLLNNRLCNYLSQHKIIDSKQAGFQKGKRTSDNIFILNCLVEKYTRNSGKLYTCFVDFKQAFDSVNPLFLIYKLRNAGIGGNMYNILKDMTFSHRPQLTVKIGHYLSKTFNSELGVRQGDPLSPTLFNLFINDLTKYITSVKEVPALNNEKVNCLLYADDLVLISQTEQGLQDSMNALHRFCADWNLNLNFNKTKVVVFNKKGALINTRIHFGKESITSSLTYKYLGLILSANGKTVDMRKDLLKRGTKAMFKLTSLFKNASPKYSTCMHLFDNTVKQVLLYGSELWSCNDLLRGKSPFYKKVSKHEIEKCHINYCRFVLGVNKRAPVIGVYTETGRVPIIREGLINSIKYLHRLLISSENNLLVRAYYESLNIKNSWAQNVDELVQESGLTVKDIQEKSIKKSLYTIKSFLNDKFLQGLKHDLFSDDRTKNHGNKLRTYRSFKNDFRQAEYLSVCTNMLHRHYLAKLRLGAHKLEIETGRYTSTKCRLKPEERTCKICKSGDTEDEFHFIMVCPNYNILRQSLFTKVNAKYAMFKKYDCSKQFLWLMSNADPDIINTLASYVYKCFMDRTKETQNRP